MNNIKENVCKRKYMQPCIEFIELDNEICLCLASQIPDPDEPGLTPEYFSPNPFN